METNIKRIFVLEGLHCPHCSMEIEGDVRKLKTVKDASVNLMNQTLSVTLKSDDSFLLDNIKKIVHSHERDVVVYEKSEISENTKRAEKHTFLNDIELIKIGCGAVLYIIALVFSHLNISLYMSPLITFLLFLGAYVVIGGDVVLRAVRNILKGKVFDENFLMTISSLGAFMISSYSEAVAVMILYQIGEYFQDKAVNRSRKSISDLMDIMPDVATVIEKNDVIRKNPNEVSVGDIILVKPGEKIPLDGVVVDGKAMIDTSALTGESVPRCVKIGDEALSGCINTDGVLKIRVMKNSSDSTASKIIDMVENASNKKAQSENFITSFSRIYTPCVVIVALLLACLPPMFVGGWSEWIRRGLVFLVISCPCALVISVPLTFFGGIGAASAKGILIKGGNYLEALNHVETVVFDKTGTLTEGVFKVAFVGAEKGFNENDVINYAAKAECLSNHPIARSICEEYGKEIEKNRISDYHELSGMGVCAYFDDEKIVVGNEKAMTEHGIAYVPYSEKELGSTMYVAVDNKYIGFVVISDKIKSDSCDTIMALKKLGKKAVMLTGDNEKTSSYVAEKLGMDEYAFSLLPGEKLEKLEEIENQAIKKEKVAFVGDGINDAPVIARADVGIAMGALGSDAAIEAADVVLMTDEPKKIIEALKIARDTKKIVMFNIVFAIGVKLIFLLLGALGFIGMWFAVFGDVGVMIIAVLNAMRILKK